MEVIVGGVSNKLHSREQSCPSGAKVTLNILSSACPVICTGGERDEMEESWRRDEDMDKDEDVDVDEDEDEELVELIP